MRPIDLSKFRKSITKSIPGIGIGFHDPDTWVDTGAYALNYLISGDFKKGIPLGKVSIFAGTSGSAKSLLCSGSIARHAQKNGIFPVIIDTENAIDEKWLQALEVDTSPDKLLKVSLTLTTEVAKFMHEFVEGYKSEYGGLDAAERPKVLFILDSLGMLLTPLDVEQFNDGSLSGRIGGAAKHIKALVKNMVGILANWNIGMICTNHTMESGDSYKPDPIILGGTGQIFAASIVVSMNKKKLREDDEGKKSTDINGIISKVQVVKSRFSKPFEDIELKIPYNTGLDPYTGLFDLFEKKGIIQKEGNRYSYTSPVDGTVIKEFRKNWLPEHFDRVMNEWHNLETKYVPGDVSEHDEHDEDAD
jgi:RecA/RadA recombinase